MATYDWPASLPQSLLLDNLQHEFPTGSIRVEMGAGPAFQRQRFTAATTPFTGSIWVTKTQYSTLLQFYKDTLGMGSLPFNWKHPLTGEDAEVQFNIDEPPSASAQQGTKIRVDMNIEVLA